MEPPIMGFIRDILSRLQTNGFPDAICAGGALRDIDNGRAGVVKDVDVVIFDRPGYLFDLKRAMAGFQHKVAVREEVANYLSFENVASVQEFWEDVGTIPVQIVVQKEYRSPLEILERHDFGICQVAFDGKGWWQTQAYFEDQRNKTFTLVRCRDERDYWRSVDRFRRLSAEKYKGWKLMYEGREVRA